MKKGVLIGLIAAAVGCAGMSQRALASNSVAEKWQGFMLRDGLRVPISLDVATDSAGPSGQFHIGEASFPLEHVRVGVFDVHFELPGGFVFDGTMAGNAMAGSVSGTQPHASFTLAREETPFADPIYPSGP
jgi:hypothetical protein